MSKLQPPDSLWEDLAALEQEVGGISVGVVPQGEGWFSAEDYSIRHKIGREGARYRLGKLLRTDRLESQLFRNGNAMGRPARYYRMVG